MIETTEQPPIWLEGVHGTQVLPIILDESEVISVDAGPGTGKTFGLQRRVQRLLHPDGGDVSGEDVLVVAFNRVIAKELKKLISQQIQGSPHNGEPTIETVHAICLKIIGGNLRLLLPNERNAMLYDIRILYPQLAERFDDIRAIQQALQDHEAAIVTDSELWQAAQVWLRRHKCQLISELPELLLAKIKGGDFGDRRYQHIIVDEFQDLTPNLQNLFFKLRKQGGSIMALGDPRQSIYAFLGNDPNGLSRIPEIVEDTGQKTVDVQMSECQRCPPTIVEASNKLMTLAGSPPMTSTSKEVANLHVVTWETVPRESKGMARAIKENFERHPDDSHLVMVTRRKFGYLLREEIKKLDEEIEIDLSFSESLLETWCVREAFMFFCVLVDPDPASWRAWMAYKNAEDGNNKKSNASEKNADAYVNFFTASDDNITDAVLHAMVETGGNPKGTGGKNIRERAERYFELKDLHPIDFENLDAFIEGLFDIEKWKVESDELETAKIDMSLAREKTLDILRDSKEKKPEMDPADRARSIVRTLRYQIATKEPFAASEKSSIQITTLWGAKGVTADHVYIIGLSEEAVPGIRRNEYPGTDEEYRDEQRRLFYVSITRSKKTMVLSRALKIERGQADRIGLSINSKYAGWKWPYLEMSPFLQDISDALPDAINGADWKGCSS